MESIRGVTKLQKLLFLIEQETEFFEEYENDIAFNFAPYKMGPFSERVYEELHFLLQLGAIEATPMDDGPLAGVDDNDLSNKEFSITPKGKKIASQLVEILEPEYQSEIENLVESYGDLSLPELLEVVYTSYPSFATESEIKDKLQLEGD
ncbi:DUF4065 domain-containing protein [Haloarcula sp. S1CR25-12]|uniref:DUF4065 domain-containing protein n=1 Tax=Haloarcula saliterrae TaxID=2950534 RepID=A0ABU2FHZ4_9EURY|nr:DUF4065 domain-containing protein [Haloarcula sp. S1CR25-12]MDS0261877.1 DUF4065 domain-containing protein [Haloarcula sp. S1CR25-12]